MSDVSERTRVFAVCLATLAVMGLAVGAVGSSVATDHHEEPAFLVDVDTDGDATVTVVLTYDLADENEQEAFETLREGDESHEDLRDRFESQMGELATDTATQTDREMSISDAELDLYTTADDVGVAELSVRWHGLAAVNDDSVTVTEPFAGGFAPDRQFVLAGPENYEPTAVMPDASGSDDGTLVWNADSDLDGFEVTFTAADDGTANGGPSDEDVSGDAAPGFGVVLSLVALVVAVAGAVRRNST